MTKKKPAAPAPPDVPYAPSARLLAVRAMLNTSSGATVYDVMERCGVSLATAKRYLAALQAAGDPLFEETDGHRRRYRLQPSARVETLTLTTQQMVSLFLGRRVFDFLDGTGFKEDLDDVFEKLGTMLRRKDFVAAQNLDRKLFDVGEAPHRYAGKVEHVDALVTALLREERLDVTYQSPGRPASRFVLSPYTLAVYKKGLYVIGHSDKHQEVRTFSLGGFRRIVWRKGDGFVYPRDYEPQSRFAGSFGIFAGGKPGRVRIRFAKEVAPYVLRRRWHPTQRARDLGDGAVEVSFRVAGLEELKSWVLGFGDRAEVLEPATLRAEMGAIAARMSARYGE